MTGNALLRLFSTLALTAALGGACTAQVEEDNEVPEMDAEGGEAPGMDTDASDIPAGVPTDTHQVVVPDVDEAPADTAR